MTLELYQNGVASNKDGDADSAAGDLGRRALCRLQPTLVVMVFTAKAGLGNNVKAQLYVIVDDQDKNTDIARHCRCQLLSMLLPRKITEDPNKKDIH
jgi:hypothetical protein